MSVSNLTNGCKKAIEITEQDQLDLDLAILGRIAALSHLIGRTRDIEDRQQLDSAVNRMSALLKRLRDL